MELFLLFEKRKEKDVPFLLQAICMQLAAMMVRRGTV